MLLLTHTNNGLSVTTNISKTKCVFSEQSTLFRAGKAIDIHSKTTYVVLQLKLTYIICSYTKNDALFTTHAWSRGRHVIITKWLGVTRRSSVIVAEAIAEPPYIIHMLCVFPQPCETNKLCY